MMSRVPRIVLMTTLTTSLALLGGCVASLEPLRTRQSVSSKAGYTVSRNMVYTPPTWPKPVLGDFYKPNGAMSAPAVLLIHGGGWTGKDGRWQMTSIAKKLVGRGYAVLNVTYRLAPRWTYPAPVDDLREAVKWLRKNAAAQGIDPDRIAAFGYSAGGYLAAMVAFEQGKNQMDIAAVVAGGAPSDLTLYPGGDLVPQFLGGTQKEIPQRFKEASPVNYITKSSPPTFVYHSKADRLVPRGHADALIGSLKKSGVNHSVYWLEGKGHIATFLFPEEAIERSIDFLDRTLER